MKKIFIRFSIIFAMMLVCSVLLSSPAMSDPSTVTIVGEVNDQYQIIAQDGTIYEIADTDMGNELSRLIGAVVEVAGDVREEDGVKIIEVASFKPKQE